MLRKIAAKLGEAPYPPNDPLGVNNGFVIRRGLVLQIASADFYDVQQGFAALTDWLHAQSCRGIKYSFDGPGWLGVLNETEP